MQNVINVQFLSSNLFHCRTESLKSETRTRTSHRHTPVVITQALPLHPKQIVIIWTNWYDPKSIFNVSFCQKASRASQLDKVNCIINSSLANSGMLRVNTVIDWGALWIRQVVYQTKLAWGLLRNNSQGGYTEWMKWRKLKGLANLWESSSFLILSSTTVGCRKAQTRFLAVEDTLSPWKWIGKPKLKPE